MQTLVGPQTLESLALATGQAATRTFFRRNVDAVVTDLQMPAGDGLELIEAISDLVPDMPIITAP